MGGGQSAMPTMPTFNSSQVANDQIKASANSAITQTQLNNTNQITPFGNLTYQNTGGAYDYNGNWIPTYTASQTLSEPVQHLVNQVEYNAGQANDQAASALKRYGDMAPIGSQAQYQNNAYNALMARQNQNFDLQQQQLDAKLANQGVGAGSAAYNNAYQPLERSRVDAANQALLSANQLAGQNISQDESLRQQAMAEVQSLYGLGKGFQQPSFVNTPQTNVSTPDVAAPAIAAYQGQLSTYNNQLANYYQSQNATMGGLFGLGGSVLGGLGQAAGAKAFGPGGFLSLIGS